MKQAYTLAEKLCMNWNRVAVLSRLRSNESIRQAPLNKDEFDYRVAVQNKYAGSGEFDDDLFILPTKPDTYLDPRKLARVIRNHAINQIF